ncbi:hypothetical protein A2336_03670, partial [Candidatus Peregrinibacteria bacterium RIFOXYB2_FULL_41_88]
KRGKIFTRHAKLIEIAARSGGDPSMNPSLRLAIDNARADNLPNMNIDRAIKKGTGEDKGAAQLVETIYEGYAPGGVALYIETISDNKNRTVSSVRSILTKHNGSMGSAGCVGWMFEKKGMIILKPTSLPQDDVEMKIIDSGASDFKKEDDTYCVFTSFTDLNSVAENLDALDEDEDVTNIFMNCELPE